MKVITLLENRTISQEFIAKHGLSLYIETGKQKILFDTGVDDSFAINAKKLGVDLSEVEILVISHGHYDHGGGLETFLENNSKATIYMSRKAFGDYYSESADKFKRYIGIDKKLKDNKRIVFIDDDMQVNQNIIIFQVPKGTKLIPKGNSRLFQKMTDDNFKVDLFEHEINLLIRENKKQILFCGCAHRGIVNIIEKALILSGREISTVIGGMHLKWVDIKKQEDEEYLDLLSVELNNFHVKSYYTCHCTGEDAYNYLVGKMSNLKELKTGMIIEV